MDRRNFFDGLLWGAILGGTAVFLLGTKKGRQITKMITEEGMNKASQLENMFEKYQDSAELDELEEQVKDVKKEAGVQIKKAEKTTRSLFRNLPGKK